ncbi:hypothetical protein LCM17_23470 [Cereibacter sphaeroides]|nr:hypothetical protein [Cereibacter sphaeroides]
MAVRTPLASDPTGPELITHVNAREKTLFDAARFALTDVAGTANAVTATLDPDFDGDGLVDGMAFGITWAATNTGGVTLTINGGTALAVLDADGSALTAGMLASGMRSTIEYIAGAFRLQSPASSVASFGRYYWLFTASGTWSAPELPDDTMVVVEMWAGGAGGGASSTGGGGGGYACGRFRLGDLSSSVTCTIGPGGAVDADGGNTTFGTYLTAYGGSAGGGGGGTNAPGSGPIGGLLGGGSASHDPGGGGSILAAVQPTMPGGGGFGGWSSIGAANGGPAVHGGGGGGHGGGTGGASKFGGNGGNGGVAGTAPGGGGGQNAAGARGEIRLWI